MKIQILLLYYDRPQMVRNALESIRDQDYGSWELAFIDDGSQNPGKPLVEEILADHLDKVVFYNSGDSVAAKKLNGGSCVGKFMNKAIADSNAEIAIMLCDDDALVSDYLSNLSHWFTENPSKQYVYSHVILFDPFAEKPGDFESVTIDWLGHPQHRHKNRYNKRRRINPANGLDSSQVAWRTRCNTEDHIWFPHPQTVNLDATFYAGLSRKYGQVEFSGFTGQYKGYHRDNLCIKNNRSSQKDLYRIEDLSKDCSR